MESNQNGPPRNLGLFTGPEVQEPDAEGKRKRAHRHYQHIAFIQFLLAYILLTLASVVAGYFARQSTESANLLCIPGFIAGILVLFCAVTSCYLARKIPRFNESLEMTRNLFWALRASRLAALIAIGGCLCIVFPVCFGFSKDFHSNGLKGLAIGLIILLVLSLASGVYTMLVLWMYTKYFGLIFDSRSRMKLDNPLQQVDPQQNHQPRNLPTGDHQSSQHGHHSSQPHHRSQHQISPRDQVRFHQEWQQRVPQRTFQHPAHRQQQVFFLQSDREELAFQRQVPERGRPEGRRRDAYHHLRREQQPRRQGQPNEATAELEGPPTYWEAISTVTFTDTTPCDIYV